MGSNAAIMAQAAASVRTFAEAGVRRFCHTLANASTMAQGRAPGAPVGTFGKTSRQPGELRGSLRVTLDSPSTEEPTPRPYHPIPGDAEVDAALASWSLGRPIWFRWIAGHAHIIEGGRRPSSRGFMIGSDQAPDGFVWLARDEALADLDGWRG